ncbi:MAG: hypothetical protein ITD42_03900, partial [Nitrosospira sp.]|nr:hypothetical protein [Nitrosospira sp.]MBI0414695.1 hypothetical protein [Nitrosospira sp.]MBI0417085.1 hypothetical protein [Nitrosospira sp.]
MSKTPVTRGQANDVRTHHMTVPRKHAGECLMSKAAAKAIHWAEQGYIPDAAIRAGIRLLI